VEEKAFDERAHVPDPLPCHRFGNASRGKKFEQTACFMLR
jgi:hypothetical protein